MLCYYTDTRSLLKHTNLNITEFLTKNYFFYYRLSIIYCRRILTITAKQKPIRDLRQNLIHGPLIKRVYAECSPLLVKLINTLKKDKDDTILKKNYR